MRLILTLDYISIVSLLILPSTSTYFLSRNFPERSRTCGFPLRAGGWDAITKQMVVVVVVVVVSNDNEQYTSFIYVAGWS